MASTGVSKRRPSRESIGPLPAINDGETIADLLTRLGNVPANRVRLHPTPGTATEKDLIRVLDHENRPCELVEGTLAPYSRCRLVTESVFRVCPHRGRRRWQLGLH